MVSFLRKLRSSSVASSVSMEIEDSISSSYEYSFAVVYNGPPITHSIPEIPAFKLDQIPIAAIAPSPSYHDFSIPVIQPLGKFDHKYKNKHKHKLSSTDSRVFPNLDSHSSSSVVTLKSEVDVFDNNPSTFGASSEVDNDVPTNSDTIESVSNTSTSEICSINEDEVKDESEKLSTAKHAKRPSAVTFRDPESNYVIETNSKEFSESVPVKPRAARPGKKGTCYKCLKRNSFMEREACIVCSAKYCRTCVIRAMGSMPQGRKCVTCIGYRIDENKRSKLGKCSRMLKQVLSEFLVDQVMDDERSCEVNQIPPELVRVNLQPLNREQLMLLLNCPNPPKQLKPGYYWYDKASGYWGKEGHPPCEIISPQLNVGDRLQKNASNGNTNVTINDREITQKELWILKMAGVPCEGTPNFWVNADGSCQEEGQKNNRGRIWDKRRAKFVCTILSLPVPSKSVALSAEGETANKDTLNKKTFYKFLLLGSVNSGACTIFKQAKILYNVPFSESELQNVKLAIQSNLFTYLGILLEGRENFEKESLLESRKTSPVDESTSSENSNENVDATPYSISPRLKGFADWLLKCMVLGNLDAIFPAAIREYGPMVEDLWRDNAIQATYNRRNELKMLPRSANYFLDRAIEISNVDYHPSDMDILYAEGISLSNSLNSIEFSFPKKRSEETLHADYQIDSSLRYQLIRLHPKCLGENCKWLEMFEDTDVVLFSVALTDYDEYTIDNKGVAANKMLLAKNLFENIIAHPNFHNKKFLLILTKFDLLEEKIENVPLKTCEWFCDFNPVISRNQKKGGNNNGNNTSLAQSAFQYIAVKFKRLFHSLTQRNLFVSQVTGLEPDTIDESLRYGREVIEWEKWDPSVVSEKSEITTTSIEEASSS